MVFNEKLQMVVGEKRMAMSAGRGWKYILTLIGYDTTALSRSTTIQ